MISAAVLGAALIANVNTVYASSEDQNVAVQSSSISSSSASSVVSEESSSSSSSSTQGESSTRSNEASSQNVQTESSSNTDDTMIATSGSIVSNTNASVANKTDDEISHTIALTPAGENNTISTSQAIVDIDQSKGNFDAEVIITNNNTSDRKVISAIVLPAAYTTGENAVQVVLDGSRMSSLSLGLDNEAITYAIQSGQYKTLAELQANGNFSWDKVVGIRIEGIAKANQSYTVVLPLTIANYADMQKQLTDILDGNADSDISTQSSLRQFSLSEYFYYFDENNNLKYGTNNTVIGRVAKEASGLEDAVKKSNITNYAKILVTDGQTRYYLNADDLNQMTDENGNNILPPITSQDFSYYNFGISETSSDKLYTDGIYAINLEKIFNAIRNKGYSVNIFPNGTSAWKQYIYGLTLSPDWIIEASNPIDNNSDGSDSSSDNDSTATKYFYIQVQKVFDVQDLTLWAGDKFDPAEMGDIYPLIKAHIDFTDQTTMEVTESKDLTASDLIINSDVDMSKPGVYHVTYSYRLGDGSLISATSTVTVLDKKQADEAGGQDKLPNDDNENYIDPSDDVDNDQNKDSSDDSANNQNTNSDKDSKSSDDNTSKDTVKPEASQDTVTDKDSDTNNQVEDKKSNEIHTNHLIIPVSDRNSSSLVEFVLPEKRVELNKVGTTKSSKLPQTGSNSGVLALLGLTLTSMSGFIFKKKH